MSAAISDELDRTKQQQALEKYDTHLNQQLLKEMNLLSDYVLEQSEKMLSSNKLLDKVRDEFEIKVMENEKMKRMLIEARPKQYVVDSDDPIDIALGDFINSREDPLMVNFTKENNGVYMFGTRKIMVKIEQGKLIIKVGGGYMLPEELIAVYSHQELEKQMIRRAESMQRVTLKDRLTSSLIGSYMRDKQLSPQRAAQMVRENLGSKFSSAVGVIEGRKSSPGRSRK
jgi:hypothetical protein